MDEEPRRRRRRQPSRHAHRLGGGRRLVEQRGVGDLQAGQLGDRRLEVEQRLEPALADLRLVRRVGRVPRRVLEDVALDHAGGDGGVVAHPDQRAARPVLGGEAAQGAEHVGFAACRRQVQGVVTDRSRQRLVEQRVEAVDAERVEHVAQLVVVGADVAPHEVVGGGSKRLGHLMLSGARWGLVHPRCRRHLRASAGGDRPVFPLRRAWATCPACFPASPHPSVRSPERFRGGCSFGAARHSASSSPGGFVGAAQRSAAGSPRQQAPIARTYGNGLTAAPPRGCTSKCRWLIAALPVLPTVPIIWPALTGTPTSIPGAMLARWA